MKTFTIDDIEYKIVANPYTNGPMIARVDGFEIENRKEICRRFLRMHGWTDEMFGNQITNDLERRINRILNGGEAIPTSNNRLVLKERNQSYNMINTKVDISKSVNKFIRVSKIDKNGRYYSYEHIRKAFKSYLDDSSKKDLLSLYLYSYLASWGMLRNSFLMQKDYKFLIPIVEILCNKKYRPILDYDPFTDSGNAKLDLIQQISKDIRDYFMGKKYFKEGEDKQTQITNVTDTLITKILLGTLGCTVAYDRYVSKGLSSHKITVKFGKRSTRELRDFAKANEEEIRKLNLYLGNLYTPMKIIDMYFFEEGFAL